MPFLKRATVSDAQNMRWDQYVLSLHDVSLFMKNFFGWYYNTIALSLNKTKAGSQLSILDCQNSSAFFGTQLAFNKLALTIDFPDP